MAKRRGIKFIGRSRHIATRQASHGIIGRATARALIAGGAILRGRQPTVCRKSFILVVNIGTAPFLTSWTRMSATPETLFALVEADHLTRIHLKLGLEDVGFAVKEQDDTIALVGTPDPTVAKESPILPTRAPTSDDDETA
ncbi:MULTISPECIES: hypothetical protein [Sphingomonas]|uniref:hypothetical protein n=2 Tax=Bacteria TaxID=2 RepID=UPI001FAF8CA9|nr:MULTISPECIES: hypothetical protein [Sphingomonas]